MTDDPAFGQFRKAHVLVLPVNKWDKVCKPCDKKGRSRSVTKTRVQIPLGPPPILHIWSGVYDLLGKIGVSVIFSIGQSNRTKVRSEGESRLHGAAEFHPCPPCA